MTAPIYKRHEMISVQRVSEILGIGLRSAYRLIDLGELAAFKFSGSFRVHITELNDYIEKSKYDAAA